MKLISLALAALQVSGLYFIYTTLFVILFSHLICFIHFLYRTLFPPTPKQLG